MSESTIGGFAFFLAVYILDKSSIIFMNTCNGNGILNKLMISAHFFTIRNYILWAIL